MAVLVCPVAHLVFDSENRQARRALFVDQDGDRILRIVDFAPLCEQQVQVGNVSL